MPELGPVEKKEGGDNGALGMSMKTRNARKAQVQDNNNTEVATTVGQNACTCTCTCAQGREGAGHIA